MAIDTKTGKDDVDKWYSNHLGDKAIENIYEMGIRPRTAIPANSPMTHAIVNGEKKGLFMTTRKYNSPEEARQDLNGKDIVVYVFGTNYPGCLTPGEDVMPGWLIRYAEIRKEDE